MNGFKFFKDIGHAINCIISINAGGVTGLSAYSKPDNQ